MLVLRNLSLHFLGQIVFDELNASISYEEKIGLLGRNGAGKSTLLRAISGLQSLDSGTISFDKHKKIVYLPQETVITSDKNVFDQVMSAFNGLYEKQHEMRQLEHDLQNNADHALVERYQALQEELTHVDMTAMKQEAESVLRGLGFDEERMHTLVKDLSVGWQMRVVLAQLLLQKADFYLFDEPTNHLDLPTKEWLINYLQQAPFGYLLVTHDRYFLERGCETLLELANGKAKRYHGNLTWYFEEKEREREATRLAYTQQQKEIARKKETIERFRASATKAAMVQKMIKELAAMEVIQIERDLPQVHFSFPEVVRAGQIVLDVKDVAFSYDTKKIFSHVSFQLERGQKAALIAPNGVGKTTLFNLMVGNLPLQQGTVQFGYNVTHSYFQQDQTRVLNPNKSVIEEVIAACPNVLEQKVRTFLGSFLFSGDDVRKKIKVLSGGEKNRVAMVKVLLQQSNLLLLDEPTNHLDIYAKEILVQALNQYQGTFLLVSHDHDVIERVANVIFELNANGVVTYQGTYEEYLYYRKQIAAVPMPGASDKKLDSHAHDKKSGASADQDRRAVEKKIAQLEKKRDKLGLDLSDLEYHQPEYQQILKELDRVQKELDQLAEQWEMIGS